MNEAKAFAAWKYDIGSRRKQWLVLTVLLTGVLSFILAAAFGPVWLLVLALPVALTAHIMRAGYDLNLVVAGRYLIVGETIVYYRAVSQAKLDRVNETLTLVTDKGRRLVIESVRFPTNARKPDRIAANRRAKFDKATGKIIERLRAIVPESLSQ